MKEFKVFRSPEYNFLFNTKTGYFARWGKTKKDDPEFSKYGPEILDIEVSTVCSNGCSFCYKSNIKTGTNMSVKSFTNIIKKMPKTLTQVALGIGDIDANPDLWKITDACRDSGVIPNITINGARMKSSDYDNLVEKCGAVAVSLYNPNTCYNAVKKLTDRGMEQVNIHCLLSEETYGKCQQVLRDRLKDPRLAKLNAIVFLWIKPKGSRNCFHQLQSKDKFKRLVDFALNHKIGIGFDSCSAPMFLEAVKDFKRYDEFYQLVEPCESTLFSYYINAKGEGFPCSFSEDIYKPIDILSAKHFIKDVWEHSETLKFRNKVMKNKDCRGCRKCPIYNLCVGEEK